MQEDNKSKVNLKHLAHHTLLWIAYIDNYCDMHKTLKVRNHKYLVRMYWMLSKAKYRNANYMYRQHPAEKQQVGAIIIELGRFLTEECLNRQKWQNCMASTYLQHIKIKKRIKYWPKEKDFVQLEYST